MNNEPFNGTLTLGGITYKVSEHPELQAFIQQVASAEKSKLYSQFNNLKTQVENLKNVQIEPTAQPNPVQNSDISAIVSQMQNGFVTKNELTAALTEALKPLIDNSNASKEKELSDYRKTLIEQNLATCIPDLVKGNTREELENSLAESIRIRKSLFTPGNEHVAPQQNVQVIEQPTNVPQNVQTNAQTEPIPNVQVQTPATPQVTQPSAQQQQIPTVVVPPAIQQPAATQSVSPMQMSLEEFAKNREKLLAELQNQLQ